MEAKPVIRKSISEDIVLQIREMLDEGQLLPGDKLPPERSMAESFSVSRNTVREAVKVLVQEGVLESRQGAGTFVLEMKAGGGSRGLLEGLAAGKAGLKDIFEVRKIIEPEIAALAARHASAHDIALMETALAAHEVAIREGRPSYEYDQKLHAVLAQASKNSVFLAFIEAMQAEQTEDRIYGEQSIQRQQASLKTHRVIVDAVRNGHVMQAEKIMREHVEEVEAMFLS